MARGSNLKPGPGRPKGSPNRVGRKIRDDVLVAYGKLGGVEWLKKLAAKDERLFVELLKRVMPTLPPDLPEGDEGQSVVTEVVWRVVAGR